MLLPASAFLSQPAGFVRWRELRLAIQREMQPTVVQLSPSLTTDDDVQNLKRLCSQVAAIGFCVYEWTEATEETNREVLALHRRLSLGTSDRGVVQQSDGLSLLADLSDTDQGRFVPYTARAMGWHTDGYYNPTDQNVRCFTLHCLQPAATGGALSLMDDQLLIIKLIEKAPELVDLLSHPEAMMIPGNTDELGHDRPDCYTPVLFTHADGIPATRFTTRLRNIQWRNDETKTAAETMKQLIESGTDQHHTVRLQANQGMVTRNILHRREAFTDDHLHRRQMLRGRYLQLPQLTDNQLAGAY